MEKNGYRENYEMLRELFPNKATLTVQETATVLGMDYKNLYQLIREGKVPSKKLGGRILVPIPNLARWLS